MRRVNIYDKIFIAVSIVLCLSGSSCIREELQPCPPLSVTLTVVDKNYDNVDEIAQTGMIEPVREDLPFHEYVGTLFYRLKNIHSGEVVMQRNNYAVENDEQTQSIVFPEDLPYGDYELTVWGNMQSDEPLGDDATTAELHQNNAAGNDIYLACDTLHYSYASDRFTVGLLRTKGRLLIAARSLPENIDLSYKEISNVYDVVFNDFTYDTPTKVAVRTDWKDNVGKIQTATLLCPTVENKSSGVQIYFLDKDYLETRNNLSAVLTKATIGGDIDSPDYIIPEQVAVTISRNQLTLLRYDYSLEEAGFTIYTYVNDRWEIIHKMEID